MEEQVEGSDPSLVTFLRVYETVIDRETGKMAFYYSMVK